MGANRQQRRAADRARRKALAAVDRAMKANPAMDRRHSAIHEAGHAVMAYAFGVPIRSVRIAPPGQEIATTNARGPVSFAGHVDLDWDAWSRAGEDSDAAGKVRVAVALGGYMATRLAKLAPGDYDQASAADDFADVEMLVNPEIQGEERTRIIQRIADEVEDTLWQHQEAVFALVDQLMTRDEVHGTEVWAICDPIFEAVYASKGKQAVSAKQDGR